MYLGPQSDSDKALARKICDGHSKRAQMRINWETHWQECMDYIVPRKNDVVTKRIQGDKRNDELFDTTAIMANALLAGALHGMLTNPVTRFFDLGFGDPALDETDEVKLWLQDVADRMFQIFNNSNFQTEVHEIYIDLGAIGTSCMFIGEHDENVIHFSARAMKEIFVDENNLGIIDIVDRKFEWNLRQICMEFGEAALPAELVKKYKDGNEEKMCILHTVFSKEHGEDGQPFKSIYLIKDSEYILSRGGFNEFPYAVPRWTKTSGEIYGRGPGMDMLPDIKMVDVMMETTLRGAQKTVDPPLMVADDGVISNVRLTPGGLTIVRPFSGNDVPIRPLITDARIDFGYQAVEDVRKRIRSGFYVDQLQLNEGPQMTATEVTQRTEEKLRLMGPVLGRQNFEFLKPLIERVFGVMVRRNLIPPPPQQIQGRKFDVRYSSLVARSQRMSEGQNIARAISVATPIIQIDPKVMDNVNTDKAVRKIFDIYGAGADIMRTKREMDQLRKARDEANAKMAQQAQEQHQAEVASKVGPAVAQVQTANAKTEGP